jgi:hypothetical protein
MFSHSPQFTAPRFLLRRAALPAILALSAVLVAPAAFAEGNSANGMMPPAPNASNAVYQSENSFPENAETATYNLPGARLANTTITGSTIVTKHAVAGPGRTASYR